MTAAGLDLPWARGRPATLVREALLRGFFSPAMTVWTRRTVTGADALAGVDGPVVFVANHCSHMDTPLLLNALPKPFGGRTAVAAAADYFYVKRSKAFTVALLFNTVGIERQGAGLDADASARIEALFAAGTSLVVYPEGTRARSAAAGQIGRLRSGAAVMAMTHGLPIVPVHVTGTAQAMPRGRKWMVWRQRPLGPRHEIGVTFGPAIVPAEGETRAEVMERVRLFFDARGATTTPPRAPAGSAPASRGDGAASRDPAAARPAAR